jgi:hypothetical protein
MMAADPMFSQFGSTARIVDAQEFLHATTPDVNDRQRAVRVRAFGPDPDMSPVLTNHAERMDGRHAFSIIVAGGDFNRDQLKVRIGGTSPQPSLHHEILGISGTRYSAARLEKDELLIDWSYAVELGEWNQRSVHTPRTN